MKDNEYYMKLALKEARKAYKHNEVPVGAIIVSNDKIIAKGNNQRENSGDVTKHAELIAIRKASKKKKPVEPNKFKPVCHGAPGRIRTGDREFRRLVLYPAELPARAFLILRGTRGQG